MAHTGVRQGKFWLILVVGCWVVCLVRLCLPSSSVPPRACLFCFVLFCFRRCVCFALLSAMFVWYAILSVVSFCWYVRRLFVLVLFVSVL